VVNGVPVRRAIDSLTIGETISNLEFMLRQVSVMTDSKPAIHYIGINYHLHIDHLEEKRQYKTALIYSQRWDKITKKKV
jgi:hypothetical protein